MVVHVKANVTPDPQRLAVQDQELFNSLPESVRKAVSDFNGSGLQLITAVESRIGHLPLKEQEAIFAKLFASLGMPIVEIIPLKQSQSHDWSKASLPARVGKF